MKNLLIVAIGLVCITSCNKDKFVSPISPPFTVTATSPVDFLSAASYDQLIVQIVYVEGQQPSSTTVSNLTAFLQQHLNKPSGIQVTQSSIVSPGKTVFSLDDIKNLEKTNRIGSTNSRLLTAYIFFADGDYDQNSGSQKILGLTYDISSIVIFEKTVKDLSGRLGQPSPSLVESSVSEHEFGHVLGLVNNGAAMVTPHQDSSHGQHCNNKDCLMYWATETSDLIANVTNASVPVLDDNCINDLKAAGGK